MINNQWSINTSKEPRPQGGALKPKWFKTQTEIPNQVRDDKNRKPNPLVMLNSFQHLIWFFSALSRHTFHPRPQDGVSGVILIKMRRS
jgi:hypothetical protein